MWQKTFYRKFYLHTLTRFDIMVISGHFWEEALVAMENIKERICHAMEEGLLAEENFEEHYCRQF